TTLMLIDVFFQAEDGIRDRNVTGVQTCALPILCSVTFRERSVEEVIDVAQKAGLQGIEWGADVHVPPGNLRRAMKVYDKTVAAEIGRASCRERVGSTEGGGAWRRTKRSSNRQVV